MRKTVLRFNTSMMSCHDLAQAADALSTIFQGFDNGKDANNIVEMVRGQFVFSHDGTADLHLATEHLSNYLMDHTDKVYEEDPDIDDIRTQIFDQIDQREGNG